MDALRRWTTILADLDPTKRREQAGMRPCLIVSNDGFNRHSGLVTILPMTKREGKRRRVYAFEVEIPAGSAGNTVDSIVMPHQVRTITQSRIRQKFGRLDSPTLRDSIEDRLLDHLGIGFEDDIEA